jgi:hypothetical protein
VLVVLAPPVPSKASNDYERKKATHSVPRPLLDITT